MQREVLKRTPKPKRDFRYTTGYQPDSNNRVWTASSEGFDICDTASHPMNFSFGEVTSPEFPDKYGVDEDCTVTLTAPGDQPLRLRFDEFDLVDGDDRLVVTDEHGYMTILQGSSIPKHFLGFSFTLNFTSDSIENNGTGFSISYDEYSRDVVEVKELKKDIRLKEGKALHLYSNDYPMLYDDYSHYLWNITSPTDEVVITVVDMATEANRDWLGITAVYSNGQSEQLLVTSGTPIDPVEQRQVTGFEYVIIEFRSDFSTSGRGFHIILEPDSFVQGGTIPEPSTCAENITLSDTDVVIMQPPNTADQSCMWQIFGTYPNRRLQVTVRDFSVQDGVDFMEISTGLDHSDWRNYRRRWTGDVSYERVFIPEGGDLTVVFVSGSATFDRQFYLTVGYVQDGPTCGGEIDITDSQSSNLTIGNFPMDVNGTYCQWLVKTPFLTNINVMVNNMMAEANYDFLEIGYGSNPTVIGSRQKLLMGNGEMMSKTYSTFNGDLWVVFSAEDLQDSDDINVHLTFDDNACQIKTILDQSGEIDSPMLPNGMYPHDADCQWIIQVRGGFQVRLHFLEFDLENGHDQLIIGGTQPNDDDVYSPYLVLTGSGMPEDVVSRYNGLNIRFKTDSSVASTGFKMTFQEFFDCPEGYEYDSTNTTCYKFSNTPKSWYEARYDCDNVEDGDLVVIGDDEENSYILERIQELQEGDETETWWIGFYDEAIPGSWVWVDCAESTLFGRFNWKIGAPDGGLEHCAYTSSDNGRYDDSLCSRNMSYICEITRKTYVDSDCYPSSFRVESIGFGEVGLAFTTSQYLCDVAGYQIRYNNTDADYTYIDLVGAETDTASVMGLQPGTTYHFELTTCTVTYGCYSYRTALSVLASTTACQPGYTYAYDGSCYGVFDETLTWSEARRECVGDGGEEENADLVNIETMAENDFLQPLLNSGAYWVGMYDVEEEGEFRWTGQCVLPPFRNWNETNHPKNDDLDCVTMDPTGSWSDADCSMPVSGYICEQRDRDPLVPAPTDLLPGSFSGSPTDSSVLLTWVPVDASCDILEYHINVSDWSGLVQDVTVSGGASSDQLITGLDLGTTYVFTLEPVTFTFGTTLGAVLTSAKTTGCPDLYEGGPDGVCYRMGLVPVTQEEAVQACAENPGSHLAAINTLEEFNYFQQRMTEPAWIGYSDIEEEGTFVWADCWPSSGNSWDTPQNNNDSNDCVVIDGSETVAKDCSEEHLFICEAVEEFDPIPTNFTATPISSEEVLLSWNAPEDVCWVTGYIIRYNDDGTRSEVQVEGGEETSVRVMNLEPSTQYFFTIAPVVPYQDYPQSFPISATTLEGPPCPTGYVQGFEGFCYKFATEIKSWTDARADCRAETNSDLVEIQSAEKNEYITNMTASAPHWIGLYDAANEGDWRWGSDCMTPTFVSWASGEPGNGLIPQEDCAAINGISGEWSDLSCDMILSYVCEIRPRGRQPNAVSPSGFSTDSRSPSTVTVSWTPNSRQCDILSYTVGWLGQDGVRGVQAVPGGESDIYLITDLMPDTMYSVFIDTITFSFGSLGNSAGSEVRTVAACADGFELGNNSRCYSFRNDLTVDFNGARQICQRNPGADLAVIETAEEHEFITSRAGPGDWWVGLYDKAEEGEFRWVDCTDMNLWQTSNWAAGQPDDEDGSQDCGMMVSTGQWLDWPCERPNMFICELDPLANPGDPTPTDFAATTLSIVSIRLTWMPSDYNCDVIGYSIRVTQGLDSTTVLVEGGDSDAYTFNNLMRDTEYRFRIAIVTDLGTGLYSDAITARTDNETDVCPDGYERGYLNRCYRFVQDVLTWQQARLECSKDPGGELVLINNQVEQDYIKNRTVEGDWWIGLHDQSTEGTFRWTDCSQMTPWQTSNWAPDEPDVGATDQNCVQMISSGQWMDWPCARPNQFICEIFAKDFFPIEVFPANFSAEPVSDNSILLSWAPSQFNCDVYAYQIRYSDLAELNSEGERIVSGGNADSTVIDNLRASTPYRFEIRPLVIVDREYDYGPPVDASTLEYPGCQETVVITTAPGNISSPYFPNDYPPNLECRYDIMLETRVELTFQLLFFVPDPNDFLRISEMGESGEYEETLTLNGLTLPKNYISTSNAVRVEFVTDASRESRGFLFTYSEYDVEIPVERMCTNTYDLKSGLPLLLESPGYPSGYDDYQDCSWVFTSTTPPSTNNVGIAANDIIQLDFRDIALENGYDYLVVGQGSDPSDPSSVLYRFTGSTQESLTITDEAIWLRLETDSSTVDNAAKGFALSLSERNSEDVPADKPPGNNSPLNITCGGNVAVPVDGVQVIESPNFPQDYPHRLDCTWYLTTDQARIRLSIRDFMTEYFYDVLEIGYGSDPTDSSTKFAEFSGTVQPASFMIKDSAAWIHFTSDYANASSGFSIFAEQDHDCEETIRLVQGTTTITSPNYPQNYGNEEYCLWTVFGQQLLPIRAVITDFMTEGPYDTLEFGPGSGDNAVDLTTRVGQLSGPANESFTTNSATMWLAFTSDVSTNMPGFSITFYDDMCSNEVLTDLSGTITSPGYGFQYPNHALCNWVIQVTEGYNIRLTFSGFDLETGRDTLGIVGSRAEPLGTLVLTGSDIPDDVISTGNTLAIRFSADSAGVATGFSFTYEQFYDCPEGYIEADANGPTCYKFGSAPLTWQAAREDCRSTPGADLAVITSALENRYIRDVSGGDQWWIGLYDAASEGIFYYVECDTPTNNWAIYNWGDDQPSRVPGNLEDCVYIDGADSYYYDDRCDLAKPYICETLKVEDVIPDAFNPTDFDVEAVSSDTLRVSWNPSSYYCDITGYRVTLETENMGRIIAFPGYDRSSINADSLSSSTSYLVSLNAETFTFGSLPDVGSINATTLPEGVTNCPPNYEQGPDFTCWRFGVAPQTWFDARLLCQADDPDSDLAVIDTREELDFVNSSRVLEQATYWIGMSDLGQERLFRWVDCQSLSLWQTLNWAPGQPQDLRGTSDCVQMNSAGEWDDVSCDTTMSYACKIQRKGFTDEDQYPTQFTAQATSALTISASWVPSMSICNLLGYYLIASDGGITDDVVVDVPGSIRVQGTITGLRPDTLYVVSIAPYTAQGMLPPIYQTLVLTFNESTICPPGYELGYDYGCYRFVTEARNWDDARQECMTAPNGDLAIVDTEDEMNYFVEHGFGGYDWWIGLYDKADEGSYRWVDCSDLSLWGQAQWDVGQPSDVDGSENCGQLQDNAKFNDRACERALPFVCEIIVKDFTPEDIYPSLFIGTATSPTSILLAWRPSDYNCDVSGYSITYNDDGLKIIDVPGGETNRQLITGLQPDTQYQFTLRTLTLSAPSNVTSPVLTATVTTQPPENPCEDGWFVGFDDHCYKVGYTLETWDMARNDCMSVSNGDLVIIETEEENDYILNATGGNDFWIGLYDKAREGTWRWVDCVADTTFVETNWAAGQPNDLNGKQDCGQVVNSGMFNDWECARTMMYICEVWEKGYNPRQANPQLFRGTADDPNTVTLTWQPSARYSCDVVAYRVTFQDQRLDEPTVIDVEGADSSTLTIGELEDGTMYNFSLSAVLSSGPVQSAQTTTVTTPPLEELCEPGWAPGYNYGCYKVVTESRSWDDARADCQAITDGDLVVMETEEEYNYILSNVVQGDYWIGLYDKGTEDSFRWVDCQNPAIWVRNYWAVGQPNDLQGTQDCVSMSNAGTWYDWECSRESQYICEVTPKDWERLDQNPTLLRGDAVDPHTVELQWRPSDANCEVIGYRIYVTIAEAEEGEGDSFDVEGGETDSAIVKNLESNTVYVFNIAAVTSAEELPTASGSARIDTPASGECGNTEFLQESGFIISPNYPDPYSNNQDCLYTITLPETSQMVKLTVETMDLEESQDFLVVGSGPNADENVLAWLTGSEVPAEPLMSTSNQMWLRFFSDESETASGFSLSYEAVEVNNEGELIGAVTIILYDTTVETLTIDDYLRFTQSVATQLNVFCALSEENCLVNMGSTEFSPSNVMITSIVQQGSDVAVTFWISDPNDPTGTSAALDAGQLELFLVEYESQIEEDNGPSFDYSVQGPETSAIQEPWVIVVVTLLAFCFLLLCVVLIRDCLKKDSKKSGSMDTLEMVTHVAVCIPSQLSCRRESQYNENVYFQSSATALENGEAKTKAAPSPTPSTSRDDVPSTSSSAAEAEESSDPVYAVSNKSKVEKQD
ncbi:uncharacterized protein [Diadema antillarum]|uniref:uncharacterized protein n=1 Tax=Diadema antillarum TaxID=105358 RepID=UPI003A8C4BEB